MFCRVLLVLLLACSLVASALAAPSSSYSPSNTTYTPAPFHLSTISSPYGRVATLIVWDPVVGTNLSAVLPPWWSRGQCRFNVTSAMMTQWTESEQTYIGIAMQNMNCHPVSQRFLIYAIKQSSTYIAPQLLFSASISPDVSQASSPPLQNLMYSACAGRFLGLVSIGSSWNVLQLLNFDMGSQTFNQSLWIDQSLLSSFPTPDFISTAIYQTSGVLAYSSGRQVAFIDASYISEQPSLLGVISLPSSVDRPSLKADQYAAGAWPAHGGAFVVADVDGLLWETAPSEQGVWQDFQAVTYDDGASFIIASQASFVMSYMVEPSLTPPAPFVVSLLTSALSVVGQTPLTSTFVVTAPGISVGATCRAIIIVDSAPNGYDPGDSIRKNIVQIEA